MFLAPYNDGMERIRIKHFGPIGEGLQDTAQEYLNIDKLTVFVGEQGTGKSTVAKLYATFAWIEKSIVQNKFSCGQFDASTFSSLLGFYRMEGYLRDATEIDYIGDGISLSYRNSVLQVKDINLEKYILPKIQYIPAERNLVGVIDKYEQISYLPESLQDFLFVYDRAVQSECIQNMDLPICGLQVKFDKASHSVKLFNDTHSILLTEASSGLQSFVPCFVVSKFLVNEIFSGRKGVTFKNLSERQEFARQFVQDLGYSPASDTELLEYAKKVAHRFFNSCVIQILEEPEQNLFPASQKQMLFDLLQDLNRSNHNKTLITTHSPFLLPYINVAMKAFELSAAGGDVSSLVPEGSCIDASAVNVYEFREGCIIPLEKKRNISSDENMLNEELEKTNELFRALLWAGKRD